METPGWKQFRSKSIHLAQKQASKMFPNIFLRVRVDYSTNQKLPQNTSNSTACILSPTNRYLPRQVRCWNEKQKSCLLEGEHTKSLIHSWRVGQETGQSSFENNSEIQSPVSHALVDNRVASGFADDQICPLDNHNGDEERGMARVFQSFPILVGLQWRKLSINT